MFETEFLTPDDKSQRSYREAIARAVDILCDGFPDRPYSGRTSEALRKLITVDLRCEDVAWPAIAQTLRNIIANSVIVTHPDTAAHLHCPSLISSLAAEIVITALNQSMDSFDQAPIATIVEQKMIAWLCSKAAYPSTAGGTFTTGGSQSNYMGLLLAREAALHKHWNWSAQKSGLPPEARKLRILCSEVAHFTVEKSAAQLGLGTDSVVRVKVDHDFRMNPASLRTALSTLSGEGLLPMAIVATAGTTDFGSIDPIPEITELARSSGAWLHLDAAYGGALLFSDQHRGKLRGIEYADSTSIDFHKLLWQPIPCSVFLLRDSQNFQFVKMHADYLNTEADEEEGIPNLVTNSLLTSRRFDALKLWISFQSLGCNKLAAMIDRVIALAYHAAETIRGTAQLALTAEPQLSTVVFRYTATAKGMDADAVNTAVRRRLFERGDAVIGHTRVRGRQCLKFTCMNPTVSDAQMENLIRIIAAEGQAIERAS